ncbi:MAG: hypothetical protein ACREHD_20650 [Pirellulales bacterium]
MGTGKKQQRVADAATSNAGDDFHLVWAARRALALLKPNAALKGLLPENAAPIDAVRLDPTGQRLLGIDLTEYFGATSFESADSVVYSQLKYSTTKPNAAWTTAALTRGKNGKKAGSLIDRLSNVFKSHVDTFGRDATIAKLRICLVSNRPVGSETNSSKSQS